MVRVKVSSKLHGKGPHPTRNYTRFGSERVKEINGNARDWLKSTAFAKDAPNPQYGSVEVSGYIYDEPDSPFSEEKEDRLQWDLRFAEKIDRSCSTGFVGGFHDGLLHMKGRFSNTEEHNSKPGLFHTTDYIQISVRNGKPAWIKTGEFPVNTHIDNRLVGEDPENGSPMYEETPVFTDINRNATVGFRAAEEWAKFRTMAVVSREYIDRIIKAEFADLRKRRDAGEKMDEYNEGQLMRARGEHALPLMLGFLPHVRADAGNARLRNWYLPGVLEGEAALTLEGMIHPNHGSSRDSRPVSYAGSLPIELVDGNSEGEYSARFKFDLNVSMGLDDPVIKSGVVGTLRHYFNFEALDDHCLRFTVDIPEAHKVREKILEGDKKTALHTNMLAIQSALTEVERSSSTMRRQILPAMKEAYDAGVESVKKKRFGETLDNALKISGAVRGFRKGE